MCYIFSLLVLVQFCFFFSSRRRHTRCLSDWSSDVCSSDLRDDEEDHDADDDVATDDEIAEGEDDVARVCVQQDLSRRRDVEREAEQRREQQQRSEERRVGKECRARWWGENEKNKE